MKKLLLCIALLLLPNLTLASERVFFATDKSDLTTLEKNKIVLLAEQIKKNNAKVVIIGNADKRGTRLYNLDLGMRRAQTVVDALVDQGVPPELLSISLSYGEEKPLAPPDNLPAHLQVNRRVDIVLVEARVVTRTIIVKYPVEVVKEVLTYRKNHVSMFGGIGAVGLTKKQLTQNQFSVEQDYARVFGLGYYRSLNNRFSIGVTGFSNYSFFLNLGMDF